MGRAGVVTHYKTVGTTSQNSFFDTILPSALVGAGMLFNLALCFLTTRGLHLGATQIGLIEAGIVAAAAASAWRLLMQRFLVAAVLLGGWLLAVRLINPGMEPKIAIDVAIPVAFYAVGLRYGSVRLGEIVLWSMVGIVLAVGLFEYLAPDAFQRLFDIYGYYLGKGALDLSQAGDTGTHFAENGVRPDARQLFPALGLHRVGSVFLEPISAGNFAVICVVWAMARRGGRLLPGVALAVAAFAIGVLADARFSVVAGAAVAAAVWVGLWRSRVALALLPASLLVGMLLFAVTSHPLEVDNTFAGRIYGSGSFTAEMTWLQWLAMAPTRLNLDSGYSYLISSLGIPAVVGIWAAFAFSPDPDEESARFAFGAAVYLSLALLASSSATSIKTASMLWFLYGCLRAEAQRSRSSSVRLRASPQR